MGYALYWLDVRTGQVGAPIEASTASWEIQLNKTEELSLTVHKPSLARIPAYLWQPPTGGVLLTHTGPDGIEYPIIAGPIHDWGNEQANSLEIKAAGVRYFFEHRVIHQNLRFTKTTLGEIAWALAVHGMDRPGGQFPLVHGTLADSGDRERTYDAWNVANNLIAKRWTELSNVINGPDIMIRPAWANEGRTAIQWVFVHGTEQYPFIAQEWVPDFDTTAAAGEIADITVASSGKNIAYRIWCTGAGEGEGTAIAWAEGLTAIVQGAPYLETVMSDADQANIAVLRQKAEGALAARQKMIDQVTLKFPANSRKTPLGAFFVGDVAAVTTRGWMSIPDGARDMRIIKMSGSLESEVTIDFQEAAW